MSKHKPRHIKKDIKDINLEECYGLVYARVSTKKQEIEGHGLQSQEGRCKQYLEREGIRYDKSFLDSYSGGGDFMKRPAMRDLLNYVDSNPHRNYVVVFDDLKRFARDTKFHLELRTAFKARDIIPKCLNYNFDDSPEGMFVETILSASNELERHQNRRQVIQKQKARYEAGYRPTTAPKGYTKIKTKLHGRLDTPNELSKYVKEGLEGFANMVFITKTDLAKFWIEKGILSKKQGIDHSLATVDKRLRDVFYAGYIEYEPWEVSRRKGHHEAIISLDTFEKIQKRLTLKPSTIIRKDIREGFELRGFINCEGCAKKMSGAPSRSKNGKMHNYYLCRNKKCIFYGKSIKTKDIDEKFEGLLKDLRITDEVLEYGLSIFEEAWNDEMKERKSKLKDLKVRKVDIENEMKGFTSLLGKAELKGTSNRVIKQYEDKIEELGEELESIEEDLNIGYDYSEPLKTSREEFELALKSPYKIWENYDIVRKRKFFSFVFEDNLTYSREYGMRTPKYTLPIRVFRDISLGIPVDVEVGGVEPPCK